jgi:integrase
MSTGRTTLLVLCGVFDLAVADGALKQNPARSAVVQRPATVRERVTAWPDESVAGIVAAHPPALRLVPILGATCGLRQGEIFGLGLDDVEFDEKILIVRHQLKRLGSTLVFALPKSDKARVVPLPDWTARQVRSHLAASPPQPCTLPWERPDGRPHSVQMLFRWPTDGRPLRARLYDEAAWKPALAANGVIPPPVRDQRGRKRYQTNRRTGLHALRHYYASVTLADGRWAAELGGWPTGGRRR